MGVLDWFTGKLAGIGQTLFGTPSIPPPAPVTIVTQPTQQEQEVVVSRPVPSVLESAQSVISAGMSPMSRTQSFGERMGTFIGNVGIGTSNIFNLAAERGYASIEGSPSLKLISERHPVIGSTMKTVAEGTLGIGLAIPKGVSETMLIPAQITSHAVAGKLTESDIVAAGSFGVGLALPSIFKGASMLTRPVGTAIITSEGAPLMAKLTGYGIKYAPEIVGGAMLTGYGVNVQERVFAPSLGDTTKTFKPPTIQEKADYAKTHPGMELTGFDVTTQGTRPPTFMEKYNRLSDILGYEVFPMGVGAKFNPMVERFGVATITAVPKAITAVPKAITLFREGVVVKAPVGYMDAGIPSFGRVSNILAVKPRRSVTQLQQIERPKVAEEKPVEIIEITGITAEGKLITRTVKPEVLDLSQLSKQVQEQTAKRSMGTTDVTPIKKGISDVFQVTQFKSPTQKVFTASDLLGYEPSTIKPTESVWEYRERIREASLKSKQGLYPLEKAKVISIQKLEPVQLAKAKAISLQKTKMQTVLELSPLALLKTKTVQKAKTIQKAKAVSVAVTKQISAQEAIQKAIPIIKSKQIITPFIRPVTILTPKTLVTPITRPRLEPIPKPKPIESRRPRPRTPTEIITKTPTIPRFKSSELKRIKRRSEGRRGFYGYGEFAKIATVNEMFKR